MGSTCQNYGSANGNFGLTNGRFGSDMMMLSSPCKPQAHLAAFGTFPWLGVASLGWA